MSHVIRFGIDLAKNTFAICGVDEHGHDARIIDPALAAPYRQQGRTGKNDDNDAAAICEAAGRPRMRFIPVKSPDQQAVLLVHRLRQSCVAEHTRLINQLRGFLAEFGVVAPKGVNTFKAQWPRVRQQHADDLPPLAWQTLDALHAKLDEFHQQVLAYDRQIKAFVRADERASRLAEINGIGVITASALVATIGNGHDFRNGRQFAAWLGLVPRQYSTGGKPRLGRITKRGDIIYGRCWCMVPVANCCLLPNATTTKAHGQNR